MNKTVSNQTVAPGAINRQSVAVLVDSSVPAAQLNAIKQTVSSALGLVPTRGDTISVAQVKFAPATAGKTSATSASSMMGYAKYAVLAIGAAIFLFFITRVLRRRESESIAAQPRWLRELEHRRSISDFEDDDLDGERPIKRLKAPPVNTAKRQVEDLVDREPERVAMQVRAWMAED